MAIMYYATEWLEVQRARMPSKEEADLPEFLTRIPIMEIMGA